jgi:hypothetical protein
VFTFNEIGTWKIWLNTAKPITSNTQAPRSRSSNKSFHFWRQEQLPQIQNHPRKRRKQINFFTHTLDVKLTL